MRMKGNYLVLIQQALYNKKKFSGHLAKQGGIAAIITRLYYLVIALWENLQLQAKV